MSTETIAAETQASQIEIHEVPAPSVALVQERVVSALRDRKVRRIVAAAAGSLAVLIAVLSFSGGSGTSVAAWCSAGRHATAVNDLFAGGSDTPAIELQAAGEMRTMYAIAPNETPSNVKADMQMVGSALEDMGHLKAPAISQSQFVSAATAIQSWSNQVCLPNGQ